MEVDSQAFSVQRDDDLDLVFNGWVLSDIVDKRNDEAKEWEQVIIYKTLKGTYVVAVNHFSAQWGNTYSANIADNARHVVEILRNEDDKLWGIRKIALTLAAKEDESLNSASIEVVE